MGTTVKRTIFIVDIETLSNCIVFCFIRISGERQHFVLWKDRNDLDGLFKLLHEHINDRTFHVTFNGLAFDSQIIQWLLTFEDHFTGKYTSEIISQIYKYAQNCIQKSRFRQWQDFAPWKIQIPQIDLIKLGHWEADSAKPASLKWLQGSIDWPNLQDSPYKHNHYVADEKELGEIISYCYNDCEATKAILLKCRGEVDIRHELSLTYGIDLYSASEPRLAKDLFLHFLSETLGTPKKDLKKWSTFREDILIGDIILPEIAFHRQEFKMLLKNFRKKVVRGDQLRGAFEYNVRYRGISIDYGMGGIHGMTETGIYKTTDTHIIKSCDVQSYYPNLAIRNKWSPAHIPKKAFCDRYEWVYEERKKYPKGSPINYLFKILLNSVFGLSIDKNSFLSDPQLGVQITVNGQLLLTMLLEMLCEGIPDAKPLVMNTDGMEILIRRDQEAEYDRICKEWEKLTHLVLEFQNYESILAFDVNNYISLDEKGKLKGKGRFEYEPHDKYDLNVLHKNKSFLVVPKALAAYCFHGVDPKEFIQNHKNIYDFCGYARARGEWKFVQVGTDENGIYEKELQKTLRYYVSTSGSKVIKRKTTVLKDENGEDIINDQGKKVVKVRNIHVLAGRMHITEFNQYVEKPMEEYGIDYKYYYKEVMKEIRLLEKPQQKATLIFDDNER
jgi:hypothetical protein